MSRLCKIAAYAIALTCVVFFSPGSSFAEPPATGAVAWRIPGLASSVLQLALQAANAAQAQGAAKKEVLGIIDFSLPSSEPRLWVIDLKSKKVLFHELVAHGRGSGDGVAKEFSNTPESLKSSLGLFSAGTTYNGQHGYSLTLRGLEPGVNDNAESRKIVLHGAWYVNEAMVHKFGRLGRSLGCPAVSEAVSRAVIEALKDGGLLFAYFPDQHWLKSSRFLRS